MPPMLLNLRHLPSVGVQDSRVLWCSSPFAFRHSLVPSAATLATRNLSSRPRSASPALAPFPVSYTGPSAPPSSRPPHRPLRGRYTDIIPYELFRINAGKLVFLRDLETQRSKGRTSYDLVLQKDGKVWPRTGNNFEGPNGCSLRPNGLSFHEIADGFDDRNTVIYRFTQGTPLPPTLVLMHERSDHHSLQCTRPITLPELNEELTRFCQEWGEMMNKEEFARRFPIV